MADPRLSVSYEGIGALYVSFKHDGTIVYDSTVNGGSSKVGLAVKMVSADTVALATAGSGIAGKLIKVESDGVCTVQVAGVVTLPVGAGHAANNVVTLGSKIVGDASVTPANGYIKGVTTNAWNADQLVGRGVVLDLGTTSAVEVLL